MKVERDIDRVRALDMATRANEAPDRTIERASLYLLWLIKDNESQIARGDEIVRQAFKTKPTPKKRIKAKRRPTERK